jgi:hypothetical protein
VHRRASDLRIDPYRGVRIAREKKQASDQMVEPAACTTQHDYPLRPERQRRLEGQLQVGRVFVRIVAVDSLDPFESLRRYGIEVADYEVDLEAEAAGMLCAAIGGNHLYTGWDRGYDGRIWCMGQDDNDVRHAS